MSLDTSTVDLMIHARWVIPVLPRGAVLENYSVLVEGGRIRALLPQAEARTYRAREVLELPGHAVLPGLINLHGHAAMSLLRGYADDLPLTPWLEEHIWPAEGRHVSTEFVHDGTLLACAEMIRAGTTTFSDMYFFPEACASAAETAGMRCQITFPVFDFPTAWGSGPDDYISKGLRLRDDLKHRDRISVAFGPHAPYTVSRPALEQVATLAAELDVAVQIHLHETRGEVLAAVEQTGERPLDTLNAIGLIGPRTQCVHMTDLGDQDIAVLAAAGAHVVHCPQSNMKLASGACPTSKLAARGVNLALGTDGAASNNDLNLFGEMKAAALLGKLQSGDAAALPASEVLHMATMGGARALGMEDSIGSLEVGKLADMIAVDLSGPECQPVYNPLSQLVYACNGSQVTHSWVAGRALLAAGKLTTLDLPEVLQRSAAWHDRIINKE